MPANFLQRIQRSFLDITGLEVQNFTYSHPTSCHELQNQSVPRVHGAKDNFINRLFINDLPLDGLRTPEYFFDNRSITGVGQPRHSGVDAEVVKRGEYRVTVSFGRLLIVLGERQKECQDFLMRDAGQITFTELGCETVENKLTGLDGIFFWNLTGGIANGNLLLVKLS